MISCDYDPATVYHKVTVKAKKTHRCGECDGTIAKGEHYERVNAMWEGQWYTMRTCADCVALRCDITRTFGNGCGWLHGGMREQLELLEDEQPKGWRRIIAAFNATAPLRGAAVHQIKDYNEEEGQPPITAARSPSAVGLEDHSPSSSVEQGPVGQDAGCDAGAVTNS